MIFDAPKMKGAFKQRYKKLKDIVTKLGPNHVEVLEHIVCESRKHLEDKLDEITAKGGEGVMIRDPNSKYEGRRSEKLLKVKKFEDAEATVIGH